MLYRMVRKVKVVKTDSTTFEKGEHHYMCPVVANDAFIKDDDEGYDVYGQRIEAMFKELDSKLGRASREDYAKVDGNGVWHDANKGDAGSVDIKTYGVVAALNHGIDLKLREVTGAKKIGKAENRQLVMSFCASNTELQPDFLVAIRGGDNALTAYLSAVAAKHGQKIEGYNSSVGL